MVFVIFLVFAIFFLFVKAETDSKTYDGYAKFIIQVPEQSSVPTEAIDIKDFKTVYILSKNLRQASLMSEYNSFNLPEREKNIKDNMTIACGRNSEKSFEDCMNDYTFYSTLATDMLDEIDNLPECPDLVDVEYRITTDCKITENPICDEDYRSAKEKIFNELLPKLSQEDLVVKLISNFKKPDVFTSSTLSGNDKEDFEWYRENWYKKINTDWSQTQNALVSIIAIFTFLLLILAVWPAMSVQEPDEFPYEPEEQKEEE